MTALVALLAAAGYGLSDFLGGLGARRMPVAVVSFVAQGAGGLLLASVLVALRTPSTSNALGWGAAAGLGSAVGTLALYRGLAVGRTAIVAPVSAVTAATLPALLGIAEGERLSALGWIGIVLALPATVLVSRVPDDHEGPTGLREALAAGLGFAVLYVALHQAGTAGGSWPVVAEMLVSAVLLVPLAWGAWRARDRADGTRSPLGLAVVTGVLAAGASVLFVVAAAQALVVASVVTSLYPAFTVLLALGVLHERIIRVQVLGLALAAVSVVLVAV